MLKAHLDPNFDGASRKLKFIEKSVAWIAEIIPATDYSLLLDIWCGPGIYAEKFAYLSYQVTGADFSRRSNKYAEHPAHCKKINISYLYQHFFENLYLIILFSLFSFGRFLLGDKHMFLFP